MEALEMTTLLVALTALAGSIINAAIQRRTAKETHEVAKAAHIINAYDQLCKTLRAELAAKSIEIDRLRLRITKIEKREATWCVEKARLEDRIRKLEDERAQLKTQLENLYDKTCEEV